ncbi:MAG: ABC transporter substrate-binding protein, partial [Lachnospiraceae bacterium]|nr:ABC transporter substrate-binding protein [Lachnospiraceae bacterium]
HLTVDQVNSLSNGYNVLEGEMNLVQALYLNNARAPFDDERVRQALCYAIDIDSLLELTEDGHGVKLGSSVYPSFTKYFDEDLVGAYPYDPEKAAALLKEAGAEGISFTIKVPGNYTPHVDTANVLVEMLSMVGVNASIEKVEFSTWLTDVYKGRDFDATVIGFDAAYLSPDALLQRWVSDDGSNMINFNNAEYDAAIEKAQSSPDEEEQIQAYKEAQKILSDTAANVYLQDLADFVALNPEFTGYEFYPIYAVDFSKIKPAA